MNKTLKIITVLLMVIMISATLGTVVNASSATTTGDKKAGDPSNIIDNMQPNYSDDAGISSIGQNIINIISTVAIVIAVIVLAIIGVKYMIGSASEKAEYKKTMIPYIVGAILVFGAGAIAKVVVGMASTITGS